MNHGVFLILSFCLFSASSAVAQLASINPSSSPYENPRNVFASPLFASNVGTYREDFGGNLPVDNISNLYIASNLNYPSIITAGTPWPLGPTPQVPLIGSELTAFNNFTNFRPGGGSVKVIFLGESAGASNDFGFTRYSTSGPLPTSSSPLTSLITNIETTGTPNITSGWETVFDYEANEKVDIWLNGKGINSSLGGFFYFLGWGNHLAGDETLARMRWEIRDVTTTYFNESGNIITGEVPTLVMGLEDLRPTSADNDYNDIIIALQFLPTQLLEIPEPSSFGSIGAAGLLAWGLVGCRRRLRP